MNERCAQIERNTQETRIRLCLKIDGRGTSSIKTGIGFFDHMLTLFTKHGLFDLELETNGDLEVDCHHTVEDTGIALGQAFAQALGNKAGIRRYGWAYLPMDETLARVVVDFSGRPFLEYRLNTHPLPSVGNFPAQLAEEFLRGFSNHAAMNLHVEVLYGRDTHHVIEAIFKGLARAICTACERDPRVEGIPSTKGVL